MSAEVHVAHGDVEVVMLDRDGVIVAANRAWLDFCRQNGGDPDLVGPGASYLAACDVVADEDPTAFQVAAAIRAALRGDLPAPLRIRIPCHAPQAERWFDVLVASRHDELGSCIGGSVTLAPSPPVRWATTPGRWHVLDLVPEAVLVLDARAAVEYVNPAGMALLGHDLTGHDLTGHDRTGLTPLTMADLDPDLDLLTARAELASLRASGGIGERVRHLLAADGSRVPVEAHVRSVTDGAHRTRFLVIAHDLRPRRAAEALLRAQEESFRVAFEHAPVASAVVGVDAAGRRTLLRVNAAMADLLGTTVTDLVGRDLVEFSFPDSADHDLRIVREIATGMRSTYSRRKRYRRADGDEVWVEARVSRVDVPGLAGPTTLVHFVDVTDRFRADRLAARQAAADAAVAEISTAVLADTAQDRLYQLVADAVARVFDAENVTLGLPDPVSGEYRAVAAVGPVSARLLSGRTPINQGLVRRLIEAGSLTVPEPPAGVSEELKPLLGPGAAARFAPAGTSAASHGLVAVARRRGGEVFSLGEVAVLARLAQQVALALELGRARRDQQRLAVLEDRQRIARDLHDTVIQDLIAIGMQLDATANAGGDPSRARRDAELVDQLEEAVRRLRGSVFDLRTPASVPFTSDAVRAVVAEAARVLGHRPCLRLEGDGALMPPPVGDALVAVLREALSNVARHAAAQSSQVMLSITPDGVTLVVEDDGVGLGDPVVPGDGMANIRHRAATLGGSAYIAPRPGGGTRVVWSCPVVIRSAPAPASASAPRQRPSPTG